MNFHIISILTKSFRFSKSSTILGLVCSLTLSSCKEDPERPESAPSGEHAEAESLLEAEIRTMLLTEDYNLDRLVKLVEGKPWDELLAACMRVESEFESPLSKEQIADTRFAVRCAYWEAKGLKRREEIEQLLHKMAEREGLSVPD